MFIMLLITTPITELHEYLKIIIVNDHVRHKLSFINVKMQVVEVVVFLSIFTGCQFFPIQK